LIISEGSYLASLAASLPDVKRLEALSGELPVDPVQFFGKIILEAERKQK